MTRTTTIKLTAEEVRLLEHAIKIAAEDGSIYPPDQSPLKINRLLDALAKKLSGAHHGE